MFALTPTPSSTPSIVLRRFVPLYRILASFAVGVWLTAQPALAQEAVVPVANAEALFSSPDPVLHANKQVAYGIVRDLLESGHWELADKYLTERYLQHNPNAASGRAGVVQFFVNVLKVKPQPIPGKIKTPIVAVLAEGDLVTVVYPRLVTVGDDPSQSYTTTWFDMWRIKDGKADEHWDPATRK